jgi:hypothetical protein
MLILLAHGFGTGLAWRRAKDALRAVLIRLAPWEAEPNPELDGLGHGYRTDMSEEELYNSVQVFGC